MRTRRNRRALGQAMVETVLGLLVFVTVLLIGIHFAEVGYMALKVQEAANFGLWDATAYRMHDTFVAPSGQWDLWRNAVPQAVGDTRDRYEDYEGLTTGDTPGGVVQVLTSSSPLNINCAEDPLVPFQDVGAQVDQLSTVYPRVSSGMSCQVQANLIGIRIPRVFFDQRPFRADHWTPQNIPVCSAGRPSGGNCTGRHSILLDDWGFSGPREGQQCHVTDTTYDPVTGTVTGTCANEGYYNIVSTVFNRGGAGGDMSASALASLLASASPCNESIPYLSFIGSEGVNNNNGRRFEDDLGSSHHDVNWETTPFDIISDYRNSYNGRDDCFLGQRC